MAGCSVRFTWFFNRENTRRKTKVDSECADLAFRNHRVQSRESGTFLLFFLFLRFPCASATPDRIIWSLLSSPKEQNASDPIWPPSRSWYMIYASLSLSCSDQGYLLIVSPGKEREPLPSLGTAATILPRLCPARRVTYELQASDRYNECPACTRSVVLQAPLPC